MVYTEHTERNSGISKMSKSVFRFSQILNLAFYRLTCVYLSCKVEEFNVSIGQFVGNLKGDREKFANIILGFELLLMDKLHYHLTVHNPFRPLEGFLIDMKVGKMSLCFTLHDDLDVK